ncbi:MAG: ABC transporter permease [Gammaproteobacteria bacterium]|nr:ABC transporter permease [Gammaproteobacteria bacterium]
MSPIAQERWRRFRANKRGYRSMWIFFVFFAICLGAELVANDKPLIVSYDDALHWPVFKMYPETTFGGEFETEADYTDPYVIELIEESGWMLWAPIRFSYDTINYAIDGPLPAPPSAQNWLGTDDQGRDVLANVLYGARISILFGFTLTILSAIIGVWVGAVMGYRGGWIDLYGQRLMEILGNMPTLFILIILSSLVTPGFWMLLGILLIFGWMGFVGPVRAEFLRTRNLDYVRAAKVLGVSDRTIMFKHILPNAMVATLTFMPFTLGGSITTLTALDFLGFGLPVGSPSLGTLLAQGKNNLQAPWLGITAFMVLSVLLALLVMVGEAVRDAFDPNRQDQGQ